MEMNNFEGLNPKLIFSLMNLETTVINSKYYGKVFSGMFIIREDYKTKNPRQNIQLIFNTYERDCVSFDLDAEYRLLFNLCYSYINGGRFRNFIIGNMVDNISKYKIIELQDKANNCKTIMYKRYEMASDFRQGFVVGLGRGSSHISIDNQDNLVLFLDEVLIPAIEKYGKKKHG